MKPVLAAILLLLAACGGTTVVEDDAQPQPNEIAGMSTVFIGMGTWENQRRTNYWVNGGVVIQIEDGVSTILSVAHFCDEVKQDESEDITVVTTVFDMEGNPHKATVVDYDRSIDLCLITVESEWEAVTTRLLAPSAIELWDPLENYSNPTGTRVGQRLLLSGNTRARYPEYQALFRYDGYYAGVYNEIVAANSMPVTGGQSGSGVFLDGALIGVVSQGETDFHHILFSVRGDVINEWLLEHGVEMEYVE